MCDGIAVRQVRWPDSVAKIALCLLMVKCMPTNPINPFEGRQYPSQVIRLAVRWGLVANFEMARTRPRQHDNFACGPDIVCAMQIGVIDRLRNLSVTTVLAYVRIGERFSKHFRQSPEQLGAEHVRDYLLYLKYVRKV